MAKNKEVPYWRLIDVTSDKIYMTELEAINVPREWMPYIKKEAENVYSLDVMPTALAHKLFECSEIAYNSMFDELTAKREERRKLEPMPASFMD